MLEPRPGSSIDELGDLGKSHLTPPPLGSLSAGGWRENECLPHRILRSIKP